MSHYSVLVIGPNVEEQMAPYQENNMGDCPKQFLNFNECSREDYAKEDAEIRAEYPTFEKYAEDYCGHRLDPETGKYGYWENPNAKWDYYRTGGRWAGHFTLKAGATAPAPTPGYEVEFGQKRPDEGTADTVRKGDVDWAAMRDAAGERAAKQYDYAMSIIAHLPVNRTWEDIRSDHESDPDAARKIYWAQPRCEAWHKIRMDNPVGLTPWDSPDKFLVSREDYITGARNRAGTTFAVVKDGKWYERGSMGWWGIVTDEKDVETWVSMFAKLLDDLPDDTQLTVLDIHI